MTLRSLVHSRSGRTPLLPLMAIVMIAACAPTGNPLQDTAAAVRCCTEWGGSAAGFWLGLWHGVIAPVTFVISLFSANLGIYEVHNNGGWYHAGFLLGLSMSLGGSAGGRHYYRRGRRARSP